MDENTTHTEQLNEQNDEQGSELNFTDEDIAYAQWSLLLGAYVRDLLQDPARAADEFEHTARALREMLQQEQPAEQPKAQAEATPQPAQEKPEANPEQQDIQSIVNAAVKEALQSAFSELRKQALASPAGLASAKVSSKRLADLLE
jgi:hypothetical protein